MEKHDIVLIMKMLLFWGWTLALKHRSCHFFNTSEDQDDSFLSQLPSANWKGKILFCSICHVDSHTSTHHYAAAIHCGIPSLNRPRESVVEEIRDDFKIPTLDFGLLYQITVGCINYGKLEMLTGSQSITLSNKLKLKSKTIIVSQAWQTEDEYSTCEGIHKRKTTKMFSRRQVWSYPLRATSLIYDVQYVLWIANVKNYKLSDTFSHIISSTATTRADKEHTK